MSNNDNDVDDDDDDDDDDVLLQLLADGWSSPSLPPACFWLPHSQCCDALANLLKSIINFTSLYLTAIHSAHFTAIHSLSLPRTPSCTLPGSHCTIYCHCRCILHKLHSKIHFMNVKLHLIHWSLHLKFSTAQPRNNYIESIMYTGQQQEQPFLHMTLQQQLHVQNQIIAILWQ